MLQLLSAEAHGALVELIDSRLATHNGTRGIHHQSQEKALEPLLTVEQLGELLHLHPKTVYDMASRKEIPSFKIGASRRFRVSEVEDWLVRQRP